jgi:2-keto-4-pentenoate hydratase/2-oxohepta-3-ene-1,7-dioic acid hydratase in catechol pathway
MVRYGVVEDDTVFETDPLSTTRTGASHALAELRLLPPCWPSKIVCVGRNYADHAAEHGNPVPEEPIIFLKPPSSLLASGDSIIYPPLSELVSYEGELGVVIGRQSRHVKAEEAGNIIFGYTCINDVTARDLQRKDKQWTRAKGFDTFCPAGPWIVPREELELSRLRVRCYVNGEMKQDAPVTDMIFSVNDIIAFVTRFLTLERGDLIATGTPSGVGPLEPGWEVRVEVEGIGALRNTVSRA